MRYLVLFAALFMFGCSGDSGEGTATEEMKEAAEEMKDDMGDMADEAADVLLCLLNFCDRAGVDLEAALRSKLARAEQKYPADRVRGKALKYDEY